MLDKTIYKQIFKVSFNASVDVEFWDGECVRYGEGEPIAKIIIHEMISVRDIMAHASLTFGEAYEGVGVNEWLNKYIFLGGYIPSLAEN